MSHEWSFAGALSLAIVGALLGRAAGVQPDRLSSRIPHASLGEPEPPTFEPSGRAMKEGPRKAT